VIPERESPAPHGSKRKEKRAAAEEPSGAVAEETAALAYNVQAGDTLFSIATAHHTTVEKLREWNRLDANDLIQPGDHLNVAPSSR
jgi:LysM repeat protein